MTIIIASKANQNQADAAAENLTGPVGFIRPGASTYHGADKIIIIGNHKQLESRYRGICPVEVIDIASDEPEPNEDEDDAADG